MCLHTSNQLINWSGRLSALIFTISPSIGVVWNFLLVSFVFVKEHLNLRSASSSYSQRTVKECCSTMTEAYVLGLYNNAPQNYCCGCSNIPTFRVVIPVLARLTHLHFLLPNPEYAWVSAAVLVPFALRQVEPKAQSRDVCVHLLLHLTVLCASTIGWGISTRLLAKQTIHETIPTSSVTRQCTRTSTSISRSTK